MSDVLLRWPGGRVTVGCEIAGCTYVQYVHVSCVCVYVCSLYAVPSSRPLAVGQSNCAMPSAVHLADAVYGAHPPPSAMSIGGLWVVCSPCARMRVAATIPAADEPRPCDWHLCCK